MDDPEKAPRDQAWARAVGAGDEFTLNAPRIGKLVASIFQAQAALFKMYASLEPDPNWTVEQIRATRSEALNFTSASLSTLTELLTDLQAEALERERRNGRQ